jgi:hypothetical protein
MGHARAGVPHSFSTEYTREVDMSAKKGSVRIELTPAQKEQIQNATGKDATALELSVEELEERIAPVHARPRFID